MSNDSSVDWFWLPRFIGFDAVNRPDGLVSNAPEEGRDGYLGLRGGGGRPLVGSAVGITWGGDGEWCGNGALGTLGVGIEFIEYD